jgi:DNA repair ATPase RecN
MSDYNIINRRRAGFLADVTKAIASLNDFNVASGSSNFLKKMKTNLDASERGHVIAIDELYRHANADEDTIGKHYVEFQEAADRANIMLEDAMDELKRFHSFGQMKDAIEGMMTRMRAIVTFKNAYSAETTTAEELQSRLDHLPALKERFEEAVDKLLLGSDEATKAYIAERQTAFDAAYYTVAGWITKEMQLRAPPPLIVVDRCR